MKTGAARRLDPETGNPTPETFLEEIRAIINSGTLRGAREVAERGLALFPDHPELKRLHHELRPFQVRSRPDLRVSDPRPNYEWLKKNGSAYLGRWVGLSKGELVKAADTLQEVQEALEGKDPADTLVHQILNYP
jgi:hypothetical protein